MSKKNIILSSLLLSASLLCFSCGSEAPADTRADRAYAQLSQLADQNRLEFTEFTIKELCGSKDESFWKFLGDKEVLYRLTAHVTAGIDLSKMKPDALQISSDGVVRLTLPHCEVFEVDIPDSLIVNEYERVTGISRDFSLGQRIKVQVEGEKEIRRANYEPNITIEAEKNAVLFFKALLAQVGYDPNRCAIYFE